MVALLAGALAVAGCTGDDGKDGQDGEPGGSVIDLTKVSDEFMAGIDVVSEVTSVEINSPPVVTFTLADANGTPIIGLVPFWEDSNRYVRFTITKLVLGENGDPDNWVAYVLDEGRPDYDTGASLVDNGDGSYEFTFVTDVTMVEGIDYEPGLTHRVAGQLGSSSIPLEPQNFVYDFVPDGSDLIDTKYMAVMESCNECHSDLVFHGRRFLVEYCTNCHTPQLAEGEGAMSYMTHRIHAAGDFEILDDAISYAEVTYPQDLNNCIKCHNPEDEATPDADNWLVPSLQACFGCHETHLGGDPPADNTGCVNCHNDVVAPSTLTAHITPNATPNNPDLLEGQYEVAYELIDAAVDPGTNEVTINGRILVDGASLDVANLPDDLATPGRYPGLLLAWAEPQGDIDEPMDFNNLGQRAAQAISLGLDDFVANVVGTYAFDGDVSTFVVTDAASQFPVGATLRAVGLQGYFEQDIEGEEVSLHTPSAVVAVTDDEARRTVIDNNKCASCHEWFEGHGGNRTFSMEICTLCHVPNLSSSGRTVTDPAERDLDIDLQAAIDDGTLDSSVDPQDPLTYPEDAQNLKDLVHGIHASDDRDRPFQFVRGPSRQGYYDWSEVTFPRGASTAQCDLCHDGDTYELPLVSGALATTVRTTGVEDGLDPTVPDVETAFQSVPNDTDWINSPEASSCFYCHTDGYAMAHMEQNGGLLSDPSLPLGTMWSNRSVLGTTVETCTVCHGPGKIADLEEVHGDD
jgi:OmcA/MtrC family decaheme c-type cytochrome